MKFITLISLFSFFTILYISCQKNTDTDILGKWKVVKVKVADNEHNFKSLDYQLTFENDSIAQLKLDVNTCWTNYILKGVNEIEFQHFGCTKICCDNNLSIILLPAIYNSITVEIDGEDMELRGEKIVYLKKI